MQFHAFQDMTQWADELSAVKTTSRLLFPLLLCLVLIFVGGCPTQSGDESNDGGSDRPSPVEVPQLPTVPLADEENVPQIQPTDGESAESAPAPAVDSESEQPRPDIPHFKSGDKVYVSITGDIPRMVIYLSPVGKDEFNEKGFSAEYYNSTNLIPYDKNTEIRIWTRQGTNKEVMRINAKDMLDDMAKGIAENSKNRKQWYWKKKADKTTVKFEFAGVQRLFHLDSITVPLSSELQKRYEYVRENNPPRLRLYVDVEGVERKRIDSNTKGWISRFPKDVNSRFELREWVEEKLVFRLRDSNTNFFERNLIDIKATFADVRKGKAHQEYDPKYGEQDSVVTLEFSEEK
jgi:hypothetical protein